MNTLLPSTNNDNNNNNNNPPRRFSSLFVLLMLGLQFLTYTHYLTQNDPSSSSSIDHADPTQNPNHNNNYHNNNKNLLQTFDDAEWSMNKYDQLNQQVLGVSGMAKLILSSSSSSSSSTRKNKNDTTTTTSNSNNSYNSNSSINDLLEVIYYDLYVSHKPMDMKQLMRDEQSEEQTLRSAQLNHLLHPQKFSFDDDETMAMLLLLGDSNRRANQQQQQQQQHNGGGDDEDENVIAAAAAGGGNKDGTTQSLKSGGGSSENLVLDVGDENVVVGDELPAGDIQSLRDRYLNQLIDGEDVNRWQFLKRFKRPFREDEQGQKRQQELTEFHIGDLLNLNHLKSGRLIDLLDKTRFQRLTLSMNDRRVEAMKRVTVFLYDPVTQIPYTLSDRGHLVAGEQCTFFYVYLLAAYPEYRQLYDSSDCKNEKCVFVNKRMSFFYEKLSELLGSNLTLKNNHSYNITIMFTTEHERIMYHVVTFTKLWNLIMSKTNQVKVNWLNICFQALPVEKFSSSELPMITASKIDGASNSVTQRWELDIVDVNAAISQSIYHWIRENVIVE